MSASTLELSIEDVVAATGGALVRRGSSARLAGVTTDSRKVPAGSLFIGLKGETFDGSDYAAKAVADGAAAVIVSRGKSEGIENASVVEVHDTTRALGLLARWHRRRMSAKVAAITGSNGKTTTKEMLAAILRQQGPTLATEGNLNNEIGAPLTLLALRPEHQFAVVETGMNHEGEIGRLTAIVEPHVGVVTNAAPVHVEHFGGLLEGVAYAKGELYTGLPLDGVAVANADDRLMAQRARWAGRKTLWFGTAESADVRLARVLSHDGHGLRLLARIQGVEQELSLPVVGLHNAMNACAAAAAALALGVDVATIVRGLATARPPGRRLLLKPIPGTGATLLDDCYNANPASTVAAIETLRGLTPEAHRIAVIGDMRELGTYEEAGHREAGVAAANARVKLLVAFGPASRHVAAAARDTGLDPARIVHTEEPSAAADAVRKALAKDDIVLVKASRGTRLERVSDLLAPPDAETH